MGPVKGRGISAVGDRQLYIILWGQVNNKKEMDMLQHDTRVLISKSNRWGRVMEFICNSAFQIRCADGVERLNSLHLWPNDIMRCETSWSTLVRVLACHLLYAKPLPEPRQIKCQSDHKGYTSIIFCLKFKYFHSRKYIWNVCKISAPMF